MVVCEDQHAFMQIGYCMTYDNTKNETIAGSCIQSFFSDDSIKFFYPLPTNVSELNDQVCDPYNREGLLCGKCREGFAVSALSVINCVNCTDTPNTRNGIIFLSVTYLSITTIFMVILIFSISIVSGPINSVIFFGQITASTFFNLGYIESVLEAQGIGFSYKRRNPTTLLAAIYDILNLNIFVAFIPPFCLTETFNSLQALALQYSSAFYPLILIFLLYICIKMHDSDVRPIVYCWRPFQKCFLRLRRSVDAKTSVLDTFATFILLSYVKLLFIVGSILWPIHAYNSQGKTYSTLYVYSSGIEYFHTKHLPYSIPSFLVMLTFIAVPPAVLLLYPFSLFQKCLTKCKVNSQALRTFVEIFQGCYKDGTNGTRDCRYFSGLYFILRIIATVLAFVTSQTHVTGSAFLYWITALLFVIIRPYKKQAYNVVDAVIFSIMGSIYFLLTRNIVQVMLTGRPSASLLALTDVLYSLPLLYLVLFAVGWVLDRKTDCVQKLRSFFHNREVLQSEDFYSVAPHRLLNTERVSWPW